MRDRYYAVMICENNKGRKEYIHKLVALTFPEICGNPFPGAEVMHLDDNPHNNVATNLRWGTHKENMNWNDLPKRKKTFFNGRVPGKPVLQYTLDGEFVAEYHSGMEAQKQTGILCPSISACCKGKQKTSHGYIWKYKPQP